MAKKRAMITVEAEQWDRVQQMLKDKGYPAGTMSVYLGACLSNLEGHLTGDPELDTDPLFVIEVEKVGIEAALRNRGWVVLPEDLTDKK